MARTKIRKATKKKRTGWGKTYEGWGKSYGYETEEKKPIPLKKWYPSIVTCPKCGTRFDLDSKGGDYEIIEDDEDG